MRTTRCALSRITAWSIIAVFSTTSAHIRASTSQQRDVWLAPLHPNDRPGGLGAADYFDLFTSSSRWTKVASRVSVFQIYLDLLRRASDQDLHRVLDGLAMRNIALAVEMPVLVDTAWCEPGKQRTQWMVPLIEKLKRLGGNLHYLTMVGPLVDGHTYTKEHYCHKPISEVAADASRTIEAVRTIYPDVIVGETEPVGHGSNFPDWTELSSWLAEFKHASGRPIAYLHVDITWGLPWQPDLLAVANEARRLGVQFGVIYNGDGSELSSTLAAQNIAQHENDVENLLGNRPDTAIFQTWFSYPDHVLPETDQTSMTGIVYQYLKPHTQIQLVGRSRAQLLDARLSPISRAEIDIATHTESGSASFIPQVIEGTVPTNARSALFAIRVHTECTCDPQPASIQLADFRYVEGDDPAHARFTWDMKQWAQDQAAGNSHAAAVPLTVAVEAAINKPIALNGPSFATNGNSHFKARFLWNVDAGSDNTGYVAIIFLGADGSEVHRVIYNFRETFATSQKLHTNARGIVRLPSQLLATRNESKLVFRGDETHAASEQRIEIKP